MILGFWLKICPGFPSEKWEKGEIRRPHISITSSAAWQCQETTPTMGGLKVKKIFIIAKQLSLPKPYLQNGLEKATFSKYIMSFWPCGNKSRDRADRSSDKEFSAVKFPSGDLGIRVPPQPQKCLLKSLGFNN